MSPLVRSPNDLSIRTMRPDEISIAVNWAATEGWNPGLADDACFAAVDPEGFLIGELDEFYCEQVTSCIFINDPSGNSMTYVENSESGPGVSNLIFRSSTSAAGRLKTSMIRSSPGTSTVNNGGTAVVSAGIPSILNG